MKLFNFAFPLDSLPASTSLYYKGDNAFVVDNENIKNLTFKNGGNVNFDTFYNSFPLKAYKKYTNLKKLKISFILEGIFEISIMALRQHRDNGYHTTDCLNFESVSFDKPTEWSFELDVENESDESKTIIYPFLFSKKDGSRMFSGYYGTEDIEENAIKLALNICTFKREEFVVNNINSLNETLLSNDSELKDYLDIFVVDNGNTLQGRLPDTDKVILKYNKNYGGSGGFARGLVEAYKQNKYTHILMMDDDIIIDPSTLERLIAFLRIQTATDKALHIAGGMFDIDYPTYQVEAGANWDGVLHGLNKFDLHNITNLLENSTNDTADYGAWWFMCMPISVLEKNGFPLPFFIRGDDIEFGLRNVDICLTMNGIGVWHESFEKKRSMHMDYYMFRNELIVNNIYGYKRNKSTLTSFVGRVAINISVQRYSVAKFYIMAMRDYLKGTNYFINQKEDEVLRSLLAINPKFKDEMQLREEGISFQNGLYDKSNFPRVTFGNKLFRVITLNGLTIPKVFYHKEIGYIDVDNPKPINGFKYKKIIHWHPVLKKAFVTTIDKSQAFGLLFETFGLSLKYLFKKGKVEKDYRVNKSKITSLDYWNEHLELENKE